MKTFKSYPMWFFAGIIGGALPPLALFVFNEKPKDTPALIVQHAEATKQEALLVERRQKCVAELMPLLPKSSDTGTIAFNNSLGLIYKTCGV